VGNFPHVLGYDSNSYPAWFTIPDLPGHYGYLLLAITAFMLGYLRPVEASEGAATGTDQLVESADKSG
jgi:hypothetical protein